MPKIIQVKIYRKLIKLTLALIKLTLAHFNQYHLHKVTFILRETLQYILQAKCYLPEKCQFFPLKTIILLRHNHAKFYSDHLINFFCNMIPRIKEPSPHNACFKYKRKTFFRTYVSHRHYSISTNHHKKRHGNNI